MCGEIYNMICTTVTIFRCTLEWQQWCFIPVPSASTGFCSLVTTECTCYRDSPFPSPTPWWPPSCCPSHFHSFGPSTAYTLNPMVFSGWRLISLSIVSSSFICCSLCQNFLIFRAQEYPSVGFPGGSVVKNPHLLMQGTEVRSLGQ